ncbi:MAG: outer membrane protein assembly factor BamD [Myxococcota bacterium]
MKRIWLICAFVTGSAACAGPVFRSPPKTPDELYAYAVEDLDDGLYPEALQQFALLKSKFPYSKFAALAELGAADVAFERGLYIEAVDAYRNFLKYYPQHEKGSYAMYRIAAAYKEQIPDDYWFLPPSAEKDQASTRLAISAFKDMIARYPASEETEQAKEDLKACRRGLADHELYVAEFYYTRERWKAAAMRAEGLVRDYSGLGLDSRALLIAAESRYRLEEWELATTSAARLQNEFPESKEGQRARQILQQLESKQVNEKPADTEEG